MPDARQTDRGTSAVTAPIAGRSAAFKLFFDHIFEASMRKHFNSLRLLRKGVGPPASTPHLVIYANHPSWWDPVIYVVIVRHLFPGRPFYAPVEAAMLRKYPFLGKIGGFGVEQDSRFGARDFLRTAGRIMAEPKNILMIPAQGRFADIRERPIALKPGVAHLSDAEHDLTFLPLAIEVSLWMEKRSEIFIAFGSPLTSRDLAGHRPKQRLQMLEDGLERTMAELGDAVIGRDPSLFQTVVEGKKGIHGVYDLWRRCRALVAGKAFDPRHGSQAP